MGGDVVNIGISFLHICYGILMTPEAHLLNFLEKEAGYLVLHVYKELHVLGECSHS